MSIERRLQQAQRQADLTAVLFDFRLVDGTLRQVIAQVVPGIGVPHACVPDRCRFQGNGPG